MKTDTSTVYVGIDVAKATLQVHRQGHQAEIQNTAAAHTKLCKDLKKRSGIHVVCEATGGYEQAMVQSLHQHHVPVSVVNPAQVRAAAHAKGQRAKTDRIDALMLTDYGQRYHPAPTPPQSQVQLQLVALTQWLQQLVEAQATAKVQAEHHTDAFVRKQHQALLKNYASQIEATEAKLQELVAQDPVLKQRAECLDAIEGVGLRSALLILGQMPELGHLNRQEVGALGGLAPFTRESGTLKGVRCIGGGRAQVRVILYMCSLSAIRHNPILRAFYERLVAKGKCKKVALTAVMRKLLVYMNHKLKTLEAQNAAAKDPKKTA